MDKEGGEWKWDKIGEWISNDAKEQIKKIPGSAYGGRDRYIWPEVRNGE